MDLISNVVAAVTNYRMCLEETLKEAHQWNIQIPEDRLNAYNEDLLAELKIPDDDKKFRLQAKKIFEDILKLNRQFTSFKRKMLFADTFKVQESKRLKFHNFPKSTTFVIKDATIANSDIPGLKSFLDDSSIKNDSQIKELLEQAINKVPQVKIFEAFSKGIQYGAREISNEVMIEGVMGDKMKIDPILAELFVSPPDQVELEGHQLPQFLTEIQSINGLPLPVLILMPDTKFLVTCEGSIHNEITIWYGNNAEEPKTKHLKCPGFTIILLADKYLFEPINIKGFDSYSKEIKVLDDANDAAEDYQHIDFSDKQISSDVPGCLANSPEFKCTMWKWGCLCYCSEEPSKRQRKVINGDKNYQRSSSWDFLKTSQQGGSNK